MEVGVRCRRNGGKPRKAAHLVTDSQADPSGQKDIFHSRRKGTRSKRKNPDIRADGSLECEF